MNRKGALSTQQIVTLIILIVSFAIILFLLVRLNLQETSDKDICHNSVVLRSNSLLNKVGVPLDCKTTDVCLGKDSNCDSNKISSPIVKQVSTKEEVFEVLADEMADCWWMFGQGSLDYVGDTYVYDKDLFCSLCNRVAFDSSVKEIFGEEISRNEFNEFLKNTEISDGQTYYDYFNDESILFSDAELVKGDELLESQEVYSSAVDLDEIYFIIMAESSQKSKIQKFFTGGSGLIFVNPTLVEANSENLEALKCTKVETLG